MSKTELLSELAKLTVDERLDIRAKLDEMDGERWLDGGELDDEQRRSLDARLDAYTKNPDVGASWEEVEARVQARLRS